MNYGEPSQPKPETELRETIGDSNTWQLHDSQYCTCLGHLVRHDKNRNDPICATPAKVAKASTIVTVTCIDVYNGMLLSLVLSH